MFGLSKSNGIDHRIGNQFTVENTEFFVKSQSICGLNDVIEIFPGIINFAEGIAFGAHNQLVRFNLDQIAFIAPDSRQPDDVPLVIGGMEQRAGHTVHTVAQARDAFKGHYRQGIAGGVIFAGTASSFMQSAVPSTPPGIKSTSSSTGHCSKVAVGITGIRTSVATGIFSFQIR